MEEIIRKIAVDEGVSVLEAMKAVDRGAMGVALVVDREGRLTGLVTDGDIRRAIVGGCRIEDPISKVMNREPIVAYEHYDGRRILDLMSEKIQFVPILDGAGQLVNLASYKDVHRIPVAEPVLGRRELKYVAECISTGWISSQGRYVRQFEEKMAEFCGVGHAIATSSGTTALHLALLALGVGPGDEVIVPDMTFIASANAVSYTGARPVMVDVESDSWCMDPDLLPGLITRKTKALMPVHLFGIPARMDRIMEVARDFGLAVVEDAAEAHGATSMGKMVGSIGDIGCFSFFGNKIVTTGEGGMVTTDDGNLAEKVRMLRDHGMSRKERYLHPVLGYNYRLTNLQAAVGFAQMEKIDQILGRKRDIAGLYEKNLGSIGEVVLPPDPDWGVPVCWMYAVQLGNEREPDVREVVNRMQEKDVEVRPFFVPVHQQPIYKDTGGSYPISERLHKRGLCLPSSPNLSDEDIKRISGCLADALT